MKIIASYSIKGGVGKTACAVNFAFLAAAAGQRVLLIDLDPQAAATYYFRVQAPKKHKSKLFFGDVEPLLDSIRPSNYEHLHLLPANISYRKFDFLLNSIEASDKHLKRTLKPLKSEYDLIVIDCPPGLTLLSENVFHSADLLLVPVIPTTLSGRTLDQLFAFYRKQQLDSSHICPLFNMVNSRTQMHKHWREALTEKYPQFLKGFIPLSAEIEKMGTHRAPIGEYANRHIAARCYEMMWEQIADRLAAL